MLYYDYKKIQIFSKIFIYFIENLWFLLIRLLFKEKNKWIIEGVEREKSIKG